MMVHLTDSDACGQERSPAPLPLPPIRVLIADEDPRVRHALRALLESDSTIVVAGEAGNPGEVLERCSSLRPSVILLDPGMVHGEDGLPLVRYLTRGEQRRVVVISLHCGRREALLEAGVSAFLEKGVSPDMLLAALRAAAA